MVTAVVAPYLDELERPGAIAGTAVVTLAVSWIIALRRPVPVWELRLTEWINDAPRVGSALLPVMQLGTLAAPVLVAIAIVAFKRDWLLAGAVVATGVVTWLTAKGVKQLVAGTARLSTSRTSSCAMAMVPVLGSSPGTAPSQRRPP